MRSQPIVSALLAFALYTTVMCPCRKTLSCHLPQFYGSVAAASVLVFIENQ